MKKRVNVYTNGRVITTLSVPIRSNVTGAELDFDEIRKLLLGGASVKEVLPNGEEVPLTLNNYTDTDLFEKYQAQVAEQKAAAAKAAADAENRNKDIANKKASRREAVAAFKANVANAAPQPTATQTVNDEDQQVSAVEAARAKIEANKNK